MIQCYALKNKKLPNKSHINPDSLRILILFANSISAEDIERSKVLWDETVYPLSSTNSSSASFNWAFSFWRSLKLSDLYIFDLLMLLYPKFAIPLASNASSTNIPTTLDLPIDSLLDISSIISSTLFLGRYPILSVSYTHLTLPTKRIV